MGVIYPPNVCHTGRPCLSGRPRLPDHLWATSLRYFSLVAMRDDGGCLVPEYDRPCCAPVWVQDVLTVVHTLLDDPDLSRFPREGARLYKRACARRALDDPRGVVDLQALTGLLGVGVRPRAVWDFLSGTCGQR